MAEQKLRTVPIKGKEYVMVNERLRYFRENYPDWSLVTEIVEVTPERVLMVAKILNPEGTVKATGYAFEEKQSSYINKTSYIENCETSAWGRALANLGIGIDDSVGSADEVAHAMAIQANDKAQKTAEQTIDKVKQNTLLAALGEYNQLCDKHLTAANICKKYGAGDISELTMAQFKEAMDGFQTAIDKAIKEAKLEDMLDEEIKG